jgi:hypothetical protein
VTGTIADTTAPLPPISPVAGPPPAAPVATIATDVRPGGTVKVCSRPVKFNFFASGLAALAAVGTSMVPINTARTTNRRYMR